MGTNALTAHCVNCGVKPLTEFYMRGRGSKIPRSTCKDCASAAYKQRKKDRPIEALRITRRAGWKHRFGISEAEYDALFKAQGGVCAICHLPERHTTRSGEPHALSVDHCHITDRVRGLLCRLCNLGIGQFGDDLGLLQQALIYLEGQ